MIKIAFVDSWLQSSAQGSGTAVGIGGLQQALGQMGHHVERLAPTGDRPRDLQLRRLWFNVQLPKILRSADYDLVVGFDIDGAETQDLRVSVTFSAERRGALTVCDNGPAVPKAVVHQLFSGPVKSQTGLGVALYQSSRLARDSGYSLSLAANQPGRVSFVLAGAPDTAQGEESRQVA